MKIIVTVYEGLVSAVYADGETPVEVEVLDYDNYRDPVYSEEERAGFDKLAEETAAMRCVY